MPKNGIVSSNSDSERRPLKNLLYSFQDEGKGDKEVPKIGSPGHSADLLPFFDHLDQGAARSLRYV